MRVTDKGAFNFYLRECAPPKATTVSMPRDYRIEMWAPKPWRILPRCLLRARKAQHLLNAWHLCFFWLHHYLRRLRSRNEYRIALAFHNNDLAHFAVIRTRDYRFPFMREDDIQVGPVWTHPSHRGQRLATAVLLQVLTEFSNAWRRVWWICLCDNAPSNTVAIKAGFSWLGEGERTTRLGLRALGTFVIRDRDQACAGKPDFTAVTETPENRATRDQLSILYTRYHFAAQRVKGKDVLEVACGAGMGLGYLAREAARVVGGDIDEKNCRFAEEACRRHPRILVNRFDAQSMPFPERSFDVVILYEAIYYLPDVDSFLRETQRVLRPGGVLLISSVHSRWPGFNPSPYSHKYYDVPELSELLVRHGFDSTLYAGFPENTSGLVARTVRLVRRAAISLHLVPNTMKGKEWLKRLFYGELQPIPREITEGLTPLGPLVKTSEARDLSLYRMIYADARKLPENGGELAGQERTTVAAISGQLRGKGT